jgi:chromosome segregation ATPase
MPRKHTVTAEFAELVKFHLDRFIKDRGVTPSLSGMEFIDKLARVKRSSGHKTDAAFWRDFYDLVKDVCRFQSDDEVAEAFHLSEQQRPVSDDSRRAEAERKRAEAERLESEAAREEAAAEARENRIIELRGRLPYMVEQFGYYRDVLPGELAATIERAKANIARLGYSLKPYANVGNPANYIVDLEAHIIAASRALENHPARLAEAQKEIDEVEAELERLEPNKRAKKRKAS